MIYITGDKHGDYQNVERFCYENNTTKDDLLIVLGDNGVNYYGEKKDGRIKKRLQELPITFAMIRGNHDQRPSPKAYQESYISKLDYHGVFLVEPEYPDLLFCRDGSFYRFGEKNAFVIGGAYSVDKWYRLEMNELGHKQYRWFYDEQLSPHERKQAVDLLNFAVGENHTHVDYFLTHTCPLKYKPFDKLLPGVDQSNVDKTMERWLDEIEESFDYEKWFCGHWHIDRLVDNVRFMYNDILELM